MKHLSKPLINRNTEDTTLDMRIINGPIKQVDEAAKEVFTSNAIELLNEPITNVIEAVWGVQSYKNQPTPAQQRIDSIIRPMICKINDDLENEDMTRFNNYIIEELIKRLATWEIIYTIRCCKFDQPGLEQCKISDIHNLADAKVAGHA
jgi:hypothetical protein